MYKINTTPAGYHQEFMYNGESRSVRVLELGQNKRNGRPYFRAEDAQGVVKTFCVDKVAGPCRLVPGLPR